MTILPIDPVANATPEALRDFLAQCQAAAARVGRAQLVSISLEVEALDPLAVLESIFEPGEPHFYAERPDLDTAIAGAETATAFEAHGAGRFAAVQRWVDETLADTIAVGEVTSPFGGPHFFTSFTFLDEIEPGEPFPAARVFVPRWQVARAGPVTTAVANFLVSAEADIDALTARVWRAHGKFIRFEYGKKERSSPGCADGLSGPGMSDTGVPPVRIEGGMGVPPMGPKDRAKLLGRDAQPPPEPHGRDAWWGAREFSE